MQFITIALNPLCNAAHSGIQPEPVVPNTGAASDCAAPTTSGMHRAQEELRALPITSTTLLDYFALSVQNNNIYIYTYIRSWV